MYEFSSPGPARLRVQLPAGELAVRATTTDQVRVELASSGDGGQAVVDATVVEQRGDEVLVEVPRRTGFIRRCPEVTATITVPLGSRVDVRTESADVDTTGRLGATQVKTASGECRVEHADELKVQTASGDVEVGTVEGVATVSTASGDVLARSLGQHARVSTASGDIRVEHAADTLQLNAASGDVLVDAADSDVTGNTASGDLHLTRIAHGVVKLNTASGDVHVGVVDGTPVWLDVNSLSGDVQSALAGGEAPANGEGSIELRVNTVSGDVTLARA